MSCTPFLARFSWRWRPERVLAIVVLALGAPAWAQEVAFDPPGPSLVGSPITVRVTGLPPDTEVVLFSELVDRYGRLWTGRSTFRSSAEGVVDPARQEPSDGAWAGVDALGPFWTPRRMTKVGAHVPPEDGRAERCVISAIIDERPVATAATIRWFQHPDVEELDVDDSGLAARLFVRRGEDRRPAVIVVPGSGGGVPAPTAELLASHGYAALALGYFGEPETVPELELVPLEYFDRAIAWLSSHPRVDRERIAIVGGSKGGELALLLASRRADLRAVVASVPSSVVFQSIADGWPRTSSWSDAGAGLPFVPYVVTDRYRSSGRLSVLYEDSLANTEAAAAAAIPVERAAGPILLITGRDDRMWPATRMCDHLAIRLQEARYSHSVVHLAYDDVGHEVHTAGYRPVSWSPDVGGTRQGHAAAQADAWMRTIDFLRASLPPAR